MLAASWLVGQSLPGKALPDPPPTGLSDGDGVLGRDSDARWRLEEMIGSLERERGYQVYLVLERLLISGNANDYAARLQEAWLPDGGGLVVVHVTDSRELSFGSDLDSGAGMTRGEAEVPAYELTRIISMATRRAAQTGDLKQPEGALLELVNVICEEIDAYFARKEAPVETGRSLRLALVTVGALSLLALCGMGLGWLMGKADRRQSKTRVFPEIDVPERLGAPYGGGGGGSGFFGPGRKEIG